MDNNHNIETGIPVDDEILQQQQVSVNDNNANAVPFLTEYNLSDSNRQVRFPCGSTQGSRYNNNSNKDGLYLFLNQLCDSYPHIESIFIYHGFNYITEIAPAILLYFTQKQQNQYHDLTITLSEFNLFSDMDNNNNDDDNGGNNRDLIYKSIQSCSYFSSWRFISCKCNDLIFLLNALEQNKYIRSLHITNHSGYSGINEEISINNAIKDIVISNNNNLSKLVLCSINANNAVSGLIEALIRSEKITDLSFFNILHENEESLKNMQSILKEKTNIKKLEVDTSMLKFRRSSSYNFDASIFQNLLLQNNNNNRQYKLDELHIDFYRMTDTKSIQQIFLFFKLLKDSYLKKFVIQVRWGFNGTRTRGRQQTYQENIYMRLLLDVIPYMRQLSCLQIHCNFNTMSTKFQNSFIKSVGKCNRTLLHCNTVDHAGFSFQQIRTGRIEIRAEFQKYLKRNEKLTTCIQNDKTIINNRYTKNALWPKLFSIANPTGPDTAYNILCKLGLSIRPNNNNNNYEYAGLEQQQQQPPIMITPSNTVQHERKYIYK